MRYFLRSFYIVAIFLVLVVGLALTPYFLYGVILSFGSHNSYLKLNANEFRVYGDHTFRHERLKGIYYEDDSRWENVAFTHFILPFPVHHPQLHINPLLKASEIRNGATNFGVSYRDSEERVLLDFIGEQEGKFKYDFISKHKLFSLPVFKNYILGKTNNEIWKDLFTRDLSTAFILRKYFANRSLDEYLGDLISTPYRELVYGLFIYLLREEILPPNYSEITFDESKKMGVVYIPPKKDSLFQEEKIFLLNSGQIYSGKMISRLQSIQAEALRVRILRVLDYHRSEESDAQALYIRYKKFTYLDRIGRLGMSFLYAAWGHVPEDVKFLKELIYFLERGSNNSIPLQVLYQYAFDRYGNNFSQLEERRKETFEEKMKRLKKEELDAELAREKIRIAPRTSGDEMMTDDEKRDYYLQQAKDTTTESKDNSASKDDSSDEEGVDYITD